MKLCGFTPVAFWCVGKKGGMMSGGKKAVSLQGKTLVSIFMILVVAIAALGSTFIPSFGPKIYQSFAVMKIGKIADQFIEYPEDICILFNYKPSLLSLGAVQRRHLTLDELRGLEFATRGTRELIFISHSGKDADQVISTLEAITTAILERHNEMYLRVRGEITKQLNEVDTLEKSLLQKTTSVSSSPDEITLRMTLYSMMMDLNKHRLHLLTYETMPTTLVVSPATPQESVDRSRTTLVAFLLAVVGALALTWGIRFVVRSNMSAAS